MSDGRPGIPELSPAANDAYRRIVALMRDSCCSAGDRLGDERGLATTLGVSRAILRHAITRLEAEGKVRRTIGRAGGVVVTDGRLERNLNTINGLPDIASAQGIHVETTVLSMALAVPDQRDQRLLNVADGAVIYRLLRLRSAGGHPLSLELTRLPAARFPGLDVRDLSSLYRAMREHYGTAPTSCDESLDVVLADAQRAELLGVATGDPLPHVERLSTDEAGVPLEVADDLFVAARIRFHLRKSGYVAPSKAGSVAAGPEAPGPPANAESPTVLHPVAHHPAIHHPTNRPTGTQPTARLA